MIGVILQATFMILTVIQFFFGDVHVSESNFRGVGAIAMYLFWIKNFFWMRIFSSYAHFITLISQTIIDVKTFSVMLILIICAYANFFHVINLNTPANPNYAKNHEEDLDYQEYSYTKTYLGVKVMDSLISAYLMGLGDFNYEEYHQG